MLGCYTYLFIFNLILTSYNSVLINAIMGVLLEYIHRSCSFFIHLLGSSHLASLFSHPREVDLNISQLVSLCLGSCLVSMNDVIIREKPLWVNQLIGNGFLSAFMPEKFVL